jgi:hypothetical protein
MDVLENALSQSLRHKCVAQHPPGQGGAGGDGRERGKTHGRRRPCLGRRPGRQPACPDHYMAEPNREVLREVYAARCWRVLPYNIAKQISSEDVGGWHARLRDL